MLLLSIASISLSKVQQDEPAKLLAAWGQPSATKGQGFGVNASRWLFSNVGVER